MNIITEIKRMANARIDGSAECLRGIRSSRVILHLITIGVLAGFLLPLHSGVMTSIKTPSEFAETLPMVPPNIGSITIEPWTVAFETLSTSMINSLMFTIPAMVGSAVLGSIAAYGLTMVDWRGQVGIMSLFVAAIFVPKQALLVPISRFWSIVDLQGILANLGPLNLWALPFLQPYHATIFELAVYHTVFGISICTLLFRGYYLTIDQSLIEAAKLDGASFFATYWHIIRPLSYPMFAVVCIFQFTQIWNEFLFGLVLSSGTQAAPATVTLNDLNSGYAQLYNRQAAGAFIVAIPTLLVYLMFGDKFAKAQEY